MAKKEMIRWAIGALFLLGVSGSAFAGVIDLARGAIRFEGTNLVFKDITPGSTAADWAYLDPSNPVDADRLAPEAFTPSPIWTSAMSSTTRRP